MTEIHHSSSCGNSPKNKRVEDIAIALELGEHPAHNPPTIKPAAITITHAIAHGKVGAANGYTRFQNGSVRRFAHIIEFTSAACNAIAHVESYT